MTSLATVMASVLAPPRPGWLVELTQLAAAAEARRPLAEYNTGTVSLAAMAYLRALTLVLRPTVAIEIGTFIGSSTFAIRAGHLYTCDKDNNCVPASAGITCFAHTTSTGMLKVLADQQVVAQFFFIDGRIRMEDLPLIRAVSSPRTVYAFDDYEGAEKGVINVARLGPWLKGYRLVPPPAQVWDLPSRTTIALLEPAA